MPLSSSRDYMSIGEVLESVRGDFPEVSISKIRFLESEGLIEPQRTASGYRKFYPQDVARLRQILALQRDQFLPLRVIKERLTTGEGNGADAPEAGAEPIAAGSDELRLSRDELAARARLSDAQVAGLVEFGILPVKEGRAFDVHDLDAASAARRLFDFGVEPRHLRLFRQWAEREAALVQQIVTPVTKKRDPEAQHEAAQAAETIVALSRRFREAIVRRSLRSLL